jgi:hypothetical protein
MNSTVIPHDRDATLTSLISIWYKTTLPFGVAGHFTGVINKAYKASSSEPIATIGSEPIPPDRGVPRFPGLSRVTFVLIRKNSFCRREEILWL